MCLCPFPCVCLFLNIVRQMSLSLQCGHYSAAILTRGFRVCALAVNSSRTVSGPNRRTEELICVKAVDQYRGQNCVPKTNKLIIVSGLVHIYKRQ